MKFKKPCLDCGSLSYENRCPRHMEVYKARRAERYNTIERKEKKKNLYNTIYQKQARHLRDTATHCYLCGDTFAASEKIEIDHVLPSMKEASPLAPTHAVCNRAKSDNDYHPNDYPNGEKIAALYLGNLDRFRK